MSDCRSYGVTEKGLESLDTFWPRLLSRAKTRPQNEDYSYEVLADQMTSKASVQKQNRERSTSDADDLAALLPNDLKRAMSLARENGASVWLTALPLYKSMASPCTRAPSMTPLPFSMAGPHPECPRHAHVEGSLQWNTLSCAKGGFPSIKHNEIRDLTAHLLTEVANDVCTKPDLQPITNKGLTGATANLQDGARLSGQWSMGW